MELFQRLSVSERRLLVTAVLSSAFIMIVLLVDVPLYSAGRQMESRSREERTRLESIVSMAKEYRSLTDQLDGMRARAFNGGGAFLSGIDAAVGKSGLTKKMVSVKPTTHPVSEGIKGIKAEVYFEGISLSDVPRLIAAMESDGHPMAIERILLKATYEDPAAFNTTLFVNTVERE